MTYFTNKVVFISGGTGGLGTALTTALLDSGAKVVATDLHVEESSDNKNLLLIKSDISDFQQVQASVDKAISQFGQIDMLINNAGITHMSRFEDTSLDLIETIFKVNLTGCVYLTKACLPELIKNKGHITSISSVAGYAPLYGRSAYAASKHGVEGFFRSISPELKEKGVSSTIVCPSFVNTRPELEVQVNKGVSSPGAAKKNTNGEAIAPDVAAQEVLKAMSKNQDTLLLGKVSKIAYWLFHLFPKLYNKLMVKGAKEEF